MSKPWELHAYSTKRSDQSFHEDEERCSSYEIYVKIRTAVIASKASAQKQ